MMYKKKVLVLIVLFLVVFSISVSAQNESCAGFWGSVSCVLWGDPNFKVNVAGEATSGGNLVGKASSGNVVGEAGRENLGGMAANKKKAKKNPPTKETKKDDEFYTCDKNERCTPDKGYSWVSTKEDDFLVQKDLSGDYVIYQDIDEKYIRIKEEGGSLKYYNDKEQWEELKTVRYKDNGEVIVPVPKTLNEFMEGKLKVDGKEQIVSPLYFSDGGNSKVVQNFMKKEFKKQVGDEVFKKYVDLVDWKDYNDNFQGHGKKLTMTGGGVIIVSGDNGKVKTVTVKDASKDLNGVIYSYKDKELASVLDSDKESGKMTIKGQEVYVENVDSDSKSLVTGKEILGYASKEDAATTDAVPIVGVEAKGDKITTTQYQSGTKIIDDLKQETETKWEGDYYQGGTGKGDCENKHNCFIQEKGTFVDKKTDKVLALLDADTEGTGKDQKLVKVEMYDPQSGRKYGEISYDGSSVIAVKGDDKYTGKVIVTKNGISVIYEKNEQGKWKNGDKDKELDAHTAEKADAIKSSTTGFVAGAQTAVESYYAITNSIRSYPALSKLLFKDLGGTDAVEKWQKSADQTFAPMLGSNWFPSAICEGRTSILGLENSNMDINSKGKQFIKTVSGTYQGVASVQGERSADKSPLLCYANPDMEAKVKYICDNEQVCKEDGFCYANDNDNAENPLEGYFYKITWAVSAPQDEKLTPLVDENGVAVTFNVVLKDANGNIVARLYSKDGNNQYPIELNNGAKDRDMIVHYSEKMLKEVCIEWGKTMKTVTMLETEEIPNVCFDIEESSVGKSAWEGSSKSQGSGATTTVSSGKVSKNTNW